MAIENLVKVVDFKANKLYDATSLVLTLTAAIFLVTKGVVKPLDFQLLAGMIVVYFVVKGVLLLFDGILRKIGKSLQNQWDKIFYGKKVEKLWNGCHDQEKAILNYFLDSNQIHAIFDDQHYDFNYFQDLLEKGVITNYEPAIEGELAQLERALGTKHYLKASIDRRLFEYLSYNKCERALKLGFYLLRADVRQQHRSLIEKLKEKGIQ